MNAIVRARRTAAALGPAVDRLILAVLVIAGGFILGGQYMKPNKRTLPVLAALVIFGLAWRMEMVSGLGVLVLALPFPKITVFGNTTTAFVLLLLVIWLLRVSLRVSAPPRRSPLDAPLIALFVCYVVSFYNIETMDLLGMNLVIFQMMVVSWLMYFLVASNIRTRRDFVTLLRVQAVVVLLVCLIAVYQVVYPGRQLVPGWIDLFREGQSLVSFRVGSVFLDFELLSEFCAIHMLLVLFLLVRARSFIMRFAYTLLAMLVLFVLFTTVTRGGFISLGVGLAYLLWTIRRRIRIVPASIMAVAAGVGLIAMNQFVALYTPTGDLFQRLGGTQVRGGIPENRLAVWPDAWRRIFEHPFIGHGPFYSWFSGAHHFYFPHSGYLFVANNIGFIGFGVFAWLLWTLYRITRPSTDDLGHPDVLKAYQVIARTQLVVFLVDQTKIEYLRSQNYEFQVWLMFALMVAAYQILREYPDPAAELARGTAPVRPVLRPLAGRAGTVPVRTEAGTP